MVTKWERKENVIAERFKKEELEGVFKKKFFAKENENLVIEKHGEIYRELGSGEFTVSGLLDKDFTDLLIMDKSERSLDRTLKNVFLSDGNRMDIHFEIKFKVFHSDRFSSNMVRNRNRLLMEDVWADILTSLIYKKSLPHIKKYGTVEFLKEDFCRKTREEMERDMKKIFDSWGLVLTKFSVEFILPEKGKAEEKKEEVSEEVSGTEEGAEEMVSEAESITSETSKEKKLAELERERLEREVKMELEKEEAQRDTEEAIEALDLKEFKDKRELLKKAEEKELIGEKEGDEDLEKQLEDLKRAKEITEKKFYKKEISEEAFQRMMESFEQRIIEIETKLKRKG